MIRHCGIALAYRLSIRGSYPSVSPCCIAKAALPDKRLAIVIDTAQNLTITGTGGKQATVIERADNGAPACSKRRGEAPWGLSDETAYSTQLI